LLEISQLGARSRIAEVLPGIQTHTILAEWVHGWINLLLRNDG
jgi:hypothetical protein